MSLVGKKKQKTMEQLFTVKSLFHLCLCCLFLSLSIHLREEKKTLFTVICVNSVMDFLVQTLASSKAPNLKVYICPKNVNMFVVLREGKDTDNTPSLKTTNKQINFKSPDPQMSSHRIHSTTMSVPNHQISEHTHLLSISTHSMNLHLRILFEKCHWGFLTVHLSV